ncbi:Sensory box histidine kinase/response regulator [Pseudomonas savastanoi pv. phaseolicola]|uniref:histidine kinase n=2 Tax=Pseudomonas savastanoi TaxID=29438 RepID=A0A3M3GCF8_PSESG|nr:PAS domain-containing sensor histidine kinase [Pseudomonas savastanoi]RMM67227.1 Sensory box histidine kinase/response regulator [Pseudomonas savastanoi pv. glycinea]RMM71515.1 Sensory box histidine kinase/response regulator [Pseudomonas savastanoi pv. glycinea]RMQ54841.1 Sensory box histidine kinase/response regulator [Pseudomonas savastanoi pv. glycinea]RMQ60736.1 Sensory box histidine kinase/response regulator [Pseudomonas savastanoi pv. phaseolicola]RMR97002.1 Sensory box histidine kina
MPEVISPTGFPTANGTAAGIIRSKDWSQTPLGPIEHWPVSLKNTLNLILNSPESMYLLWGPELVFFHNDAYTPILGPRKDNAIGALIPDLWADVWGQVAPLVIDAYAGKPCHYKDMPLSMSRYGEVEQTWWSFSFSPVIDEQGMIVGVFCITNETTEHVLSQQALQDSERKRLKLIEDLVNLERRQTARLAQRTLELDTFWEISPDPLAILDFNGIFLRVNPAWTVLLGHTEQELLGSSIMSLLHPDDVRNTEDALKHTINHVLPLFENRYRHVDGTYQWFGWTAAPGNGIIFALGKHLTHEKDRIEALRIAEEALIQAQKMEAVGQLTGGLAHDFNNLLMGVTGNMELLLSRIRQERFTELDRYINAALEGSRRAASLTHRLLAFSRRQTLAPKATDIDLLVAGMDELIRRTVGPAIDMQVIASRGLWSTLVDPHQLENSLLNLCINAKDAMPDGGQLLIQTGNRHLNAAAAARYQLPAGRYVELCVSDTGTGMDKDVMARAFDPFFTTKPLGMGTGLGLSMIYGFARQSGGGVNITSNVGEGSKVCILLPMHEGEPEAVALEDSPLQVPAPGISDETILVVDDKPAVRQLIAELLEDLGYTILQAERGADALTILQSKAAIDLLITDVGLPGGMNGRQVADAARDVRPDLKILFVTGYAENAALAHDTLEPGMHVLPKPFAIAELIGRVTELLEGE